MSVCLRVCLPVCLLVFVVCLFALSSVNISLLPSCLTLTMPGTEFLHCCLSVVLAVSLSLFRFICPCLCLSVRLSVFPSNAHYRYLCLSVLLCTRTHEHTHTHVLLLCFFFLYVRTRSTLFLCLYIQFLPISFHTVALPRLIPDVLFPCVRNLPVCRIANVPTHVMFF